MRAGLRTGGGQRLANGEVLLHNLNAAVCTKQAAGTTVTLPPKSLRSVLLKIPR